MCFFFVLLKFYYYYQSWFLLVFSYQDFVEDFHVEFHIKKGMKIENMHAFEHQQLIKPEIDRQEIEVEMNSSNSKIQKRKKLHTFIYQG